MSEKKVSRSVAFVLGSICIILAISLVVETGFYYLPEISSLNSQIDSLRSQIDDMRVVEVTSFVQGAVDYAKTNGKDIALKEFSKNSSSKFIKGELYIFAIDFNGVTLAQPYRPQDIGYSHLDLKDPNEVLFFKNMLNTAKRGNGTLYYVWPNPAHDNAFETKLTYVEKVDDTWWLGSGIYLSDVLVTFSQTSRNELVSFVDSAVKYAQENGKDKALEEFNDKSGEFFKESLYLFGCDFQGNQLLAPQQPEVVGTNRLDLVDPNGVKMVQDLVDAAEDGGGFTYYVYEDPTANMKQRLKLSYVLKVDDTWWIGAGLYAL
jgi:polar amino acid transport system substrate-binding protein